MEKIQLKKLLPKYEELNKKAIKYYNNYKKILNDINDLVSKNLNLTGKYLKLDNDTYIHVERIMFNDSNGIDLIGFGFVGCINNDVKSDNYFIWESEFKVPFILNFNDMDSLAYQEIVELTAEEYNDAFTMFMNNAIKKNKEEVSKYIK